MMAAYAKEFCLSSTEISIQFTSVSDVHVYVQRKKIKIDDVRATIKNTLAYAHFNVSKQIFFRPFSHSQHTLVYTYYSSGTEKQLHLYAKKHLKL